LDVLTRSSSAPNAAAGLSLAAGIASLAAWPAALVLARYSKRVDLVYASVGAVGVGAALGIVAILMSRRAVARVRRSGRLLADATIDAHDGAGLRREIHARILLAPPR